MSVILADDLFKCIFMNEKVGILIRISLKFVPKGPIDNRSVLVQVMAWRRLGHYRISHYRNQCWLSLVTYICGTRWGWDGDVCVVRWGWFGYVSGVVGGGWVVGVGWVNCSQIKSRLLSNSSWYSDHIWRHKTWSTLVQAIACFLTRTLPEVNGVFWRSLEGNFMGNA